MHQHRLEGVLNVLWDNGCMQSIKCPVCGQTAYPPPSKDVTYGPVEYRCKRGHVTVR